MVNGKRVKRFFKTKFAERKVASERIKKRKFELAEIERDAFLFTIVSNVLSEYLYVCNQLRTRPCTFNLCRM